MLIPPAGNVVPQRIRLDTFSGQPIANGSDSPIAQDLETLARRGLRDLLQSPLVRQLRQPSTRYNCHGLVFASRRTNIPPPDFDDTGLIDWVLAEDGYQRVQRDEAIEGDVAVWRRAGGVIDHTAYVASVDVAPRQIRVWGMWGGLGEFIHPVNMSPYSYCSVEYWRLR